jgi:uncharacterized FlaG/YvyC family protein
MHFNSSIHTTLEPVSGVQALGLRPVPVRTAQQRNAGSPASEKHAKHKKLAELQTVLTHHNISMKFSQNEHTKEVVVQLVDDRTGEAIRQIPNEVSLKLAVANIKLQGQILDETV